MAISFDPASRSFALHAGPSSYVMQLSAHGHLLNRHWGGPVADADLGFLGAALDSAVLTADQPVPAYGLDSALQEAPAGNGDFRLPAYQVELANGARDLDLRYVSHHIEAGKPTLPGLPATYAVDEAEADTLTIVLRDALSGVDVHQRYSAFRDHAAIARSVTFINGGSERVILAGVASASVDLILPPQHVLSLDGAWGRERERHRSKVRPGVTLIQSRRGESSHHHNPFLALCDAHADESSGEVRALSLVYSGNHQMALEYDAFHTLRLQAGILPETFRWPLEPGQRFDAPECVLVYSSTGLGGMSRTFHRLYRTRLVRGPWRDRPRPVLLNNWEGTYFDFDSERLLAMARAAKPLGVELFVLDDGWFGARAHDRAALGDWIVNEQKLPGGLKRIADEVNALGMLFGLWFEPEMVNPDSDLYRAHPDWCLHVPGRPRQLLRSQLVLDITRAEVRDYVMTQVLTVMRSANIGYVKWDMNRLLDAYWSLGLPAARQGEVAHRYVLAMYEMHQRLLDAFPELLLEGCSGGGARFDPGMLFYAPQIWTSDDTDALARLEIQAGTSLVYPLSCMSAHVSVVPNHQLGRTTPLATRFAVAGTGSFGLELDPTLFSDEELAAVIAGVAEHKRLQAMFHEGDLFRLRDDEKYVSWLVVTEDRARAVLTEVARLGQTNQRPGPIRLAGLDPEARYEVRELFGARRTSAARGQTLIAAGLWPMPEFQWTTHDFTSRRWLLERC
jgi:alpha-galactosidase